jgi:hypothetical protein
MNAILRDYLTLRTARSAGTIVVLAVLAGFTLGVLAGAVL